MISSQEHPYSRAPRGARARLAHVFVAGVLFLAMSGCKVVTSTQWIEAPIIADGELANFSAPGGGVYAGNNQSGDLHVGQTDEAFVKFSLATLPGPDMPYFNISTTGVVSVASNDNYLLSADKVVHARVVLYAKDVKKAGRVRIASLANGSGSVCWSAEAVAPACAVEPFASLGKDADAPTQDLLVASPGFYTFDVTVAAQQWLGTSSSAPVPNSGLKIQAAQNDDGSYGDFTFVSKETVVGQSQVRHDASLLVTLSDAIGFAINAKKTTSVQQTSAGSNFSSAQSLTLNGKATEQAYALESFTNPLTSSGLGAGYVILDGAFLKTSIVSYVNAQPTDQQTANPELRVYRTNAFDPATVTWSNWSAPQTGTIPTATASLRTDVANQVSIIDIDKDYAQLAADSYNASNDAPLPIYYAAATTNLTAPVTLDATANTTTGHQPRVIGASHPSSQPRGNTFYDFHDDDWQWSLSANAIAAGAPSIGTQRARIGQTFAPFYMEVRHTIDSQNHVELSLPVSLRIPDAGASVILPATDFDILSIEPAYGNLVYGAKANRTVGTYIVGGSVPGHNSRVDIPFENLALPTPALTGTAANMPVGAASVASYFALVVSDPVNANIDDTTKWDFTSSVASDGMPAEIQQTQGTVSFVVTSTSLGPRVLTVTSKGDSSVTATLHAVVMQQTATALSATTASTSYGQPITLTATVAGDTDATGRTVSFAEDGHSIGSAAIDASAQATYTTTNLAAGSHIIAANHAAHDYVLGSTSSVLQVIVNPASQGITFATPPALTAYATATISVTVATPNSGNAVVFSTASMDCSVAASAANSATIMAFGAGIDNCAITATQPGDANYDAAIATQILSIAPANQIIAPIISTTDHPIYAAGATFTVSASGGASGNPVTFSIAGESLGMCSAGGTNGATITMLAPGICSVLADQAGDVNYIAAAQASRSFAIAAPAAPIPTLGRWMSMLLGALLGGIGCARMRRA